jgi:TPR repeat protein
VTHERQIPRIDIGTIIDDKALVEMYIFESERGNEDGQFLNGIQHREGRECTVNKKAAIRLFKNPADQGIPEAQLHYGIMNGVRPKSAKTRIETAMMIKATDYEVVHHSMKLAIGQEHVEGAVTYADLFMKGALFTS